MADRIQARAVRRCGELLKEIEPPKMGRPLKEKSALEGGVFISRNQAATEAGLSDKQRRTAESVADVPKDDFEKAVESDSPPTVTKLAEQGRNAKAARAAAVADANIIRQRPQGAPPRTATATKPEPTPAAKQEPERKQPAQQQPQQQATVAALQKQIAELQKQIETLTKQRDLSNRRALSLDSRYLELVGDLKRVNAELAEACRNATAEARANRTAAAEAEATLNRVNERLKAQIARLEAQLADDPGENAKLLRHLKAARSRARTAEASATRSMDLLRASPAILPRSEWRKLQKVIQLDSGRNASDEDRTEAGQIFNRLSETGGGLKIMDD